MREGKNRGIDVKVEQIFNDLLRRGEAQGILRRETYYPVSGFSITSTDVASKRISFKPEGLDRFLKAYFENEAFVYIDAQLGVDTFTNVSGCISVCDHLYITNEVRNLLTNPQQLGYQALPDTSTPYVTSWDSQAIGEIQQRIARFYVSVDKVLEGLFTEIKFANPEARSKLADEGLNLQRQMKENGLDYKPQLFEELKAWRDVDTLSPRSDNFSRLAPRRPNYLYMAIGGGVLLAGSAFGIAIGSFVVGFVGAAGLLSVGLNTVGKYRERSRTHCRYETALQRPVCLDETDLYLTIASRIDTALTEPKNFGQFVPSSDLIRSVFPGESPHGTDENSFNKGAIIETVLHEMSRTYNLERRFVKGKETEYRLLGPREISEDDQRELSALKQRALPSP